MSAARECADHELIIKCSLDLSRAEHPELYDHLIRIPKGRHRMNRLRALLYLGLMASHSGNAYEPDERGGRRGNVNDNAGKPNDAGIAAQHDEGEDDAATAAGASMFGPMSEDD